MPRVSIVWVILLAAIAALAGYWAWREHALAVAAALRVQTAEQRLEAADRRIAEFGHRAAAAESARAAAEAKLAAAGSSPAGASAADSCKQVHLRDLVRDHPELEAARMIILRRDALRNLGDRLARLNLPPDKLAQLENLLVERTLAASDAAAAAHDAGLVEGTAEYYKATVDAQKDVETEIDALIGKDQERQLIGGAGYQYQVDTLEASLAESGAALTPDQQYALSNLMDGVNRAGAPRGWRPRIIFKRIRRPASAARTRPCSTRRPTSFPPHSSRPCATRSFRTTGMSRRPRRSSRSCLPEADSWTIEPRRRLFGCVPTANRPRLR